MRISCKRIGPAALTFFLSAIPALAQPPDAVQTGAAANLTTTPRFLNFANTGTGSMCLNTYVLDQNLQTAECCAMGPLPNLAANYSVAVQGPLTGNALTAVTITTANLILLASLPVGGTCNPASPGSGVAGLTASIDTVPGTGGVALQQQLNAFCRPTLPGTTCTYSGGTCSAGCTSLANHCNFIQIVGSGFGICNANAYQLVTATAVDAVAGETNGSVVLRATVGPAVVPANFSITGTLQFAVNGTPAGSAISVNGPGTYTTNYTITQGAGQYPITATFTSTATRVLGSAGSNTLTVTCTQLPSITSLTASPASLWPPNNKMVNVAIGYNVSAACGAPTCALGVASNEPVTAGGDWKIVGPHALQLRASRAGNGSGRVYTVTVSCHDSQPNSSSATTTVLVPHDQGH